MEVYTIRELAKLFKVHEETIRRWCRAGKLKRVPGIKQIIVSKDDLEAFINGKSDNKI